MRILALSMMLVVGFVVGCEKPKDQTFPTPTSHSSSGTTDAAVDASAPAKTEKEKPAEGADAQAAKSEAPAAEASATEKPATETPAAEKPAAEAPAADKPAPGAAPAKDGAALNAASGAGKLVAAKMKVPTMACPHGCWPKVKETLAKQPGVEAVELAKQANETEINDPQVFLKLNGKFDAKAAIAALAEAGFADAEVVN